MDRLLPNAIEALLRLQRELVMQGSHEAAEQVDDMLGTVLEIGDRI